MNRILPLSPETISYIRSSKEITSLTDVVVGLVENSLDASATTIDIVVNFSRASCTVDDNGNGIVPAEFSETGGLGKPYHTSKANILDFRECYGGTGSFLASLAASSLLKIVSHHRSFETSNTLVLHHGKVITRLSQVCDSFGLPGIQSQGTQVEMRDLFGNMPVRVKQRAAETVERHQIERLWTGLKRAVAALLLAWPRPCTVKLSASGFTDSAVHAVTYHSKSSDVLTRRNLNRFEDQSSYRVDPREGLLILYEAGLAIGETRPDWVPLIATAGTLSVSGAICKHPVPTRQCQFLSIGIHPCPNSDMHSELYDAVNSVFVNSDFAVVEDPVSKSELQKESHQYRTRHRRVPAEKHFTQRRGLDRWPMFVLQIRLSDPERHRRVAMGSTDTDLGALMDLLDAAAVQWLVANQFQPFRRKRRKRGDGLAAALEAHTPRSTTPVSAPRFASGENAESAVPRPQSSRDILPVGKPRILSALDVPEPVNNLIHKHQVRPFSAWSRIKSSRNIISSKPYEPRRPSTMPEKTDTSGRPKQDLSFSVPVVEAGQYNLNECGHHARRDILPQNEPREIAAHDRSTPLSDDYGSIDEMAMCTMVESARPDPGHVFQPIKVADSRSRHSVGGHEDVCLDWTNPQTGDVLAINLRTGIVLPNRKRGVGDLARHSAAIDISIPFAGRTYGSAHAMNQYAGTTEGGQRKRWLPGFLKDWENPVFQHQVEEKISILSVHKLDADMANRNNTEHGHSGCGPHDATDNTCTTKQLSKISLRNMEVISQVDRKFILCKIAEKNAPTTTSSLVIVDQHAASERVILEALLAELCTPINPATPAAHLVSNLGHRSLVQTIVLDSNLRYEVSKTEYELFVKYADLLASWGVLFDAVCSTPCNYRIVIRTLPPGISNRCTLAPSLLIEALRTELWRLADSPRSHSAAVQTNPGPETTSFRWIKLLGTCPRGIIDMLNSRACRSAIMFNDVLDLHECEKLINDLNKCAFPFVCAHGRNSMVPLVDLDQLDHSHGECSSSLDDFVDLNEGVSDFSQAFKTWTGPERWKS